MLEHFVTLSMKKLVLNQNEMLAAMGYIYCRNKTIQHIPPTKPALVQQAKGVTNQDRYV